MVHQKRQSKAKAARYPPEIAKGNAKRIRRNVELMLKNSRLVHANKAYKEETLALFNRDEIQVGQLLGSGGFGRVYEIDAFQPRNHDRNRWTPHQLKARDFYECHAKRDNGESRYCVKHLKPKLMNDPKRFQMAAADLAVEAQYLSSLDHPHIVKIRGWAAAGINGYEDGGHDGYFLILDRLYGTLDNVIASWRLAEKEQNSLTRRMSNLALHKSSSAHRNVYTERVKYGLQIASALEYLHSRKIIYRDLKPNNCGMDAHGDIKLFDMGLVRELPCDHTDSTNEVFDMSGKIGTRRYMAPECAKAKGYNLKADVYSFAMVFYEMLTLQKPFTEYSKEMHLFFCCMQGYRPDISSLDWSLSIQDLIQSSWAQDIRQRPTMRSVRRRLQEIIVELDSNNAREAISIPRRRKSSVVLELPEDFIKVAGNQKRRAGESITLGTTSESALDSIACSPPEAAWR